MRILAFFSLFAFIFASCGTKFSIQKRKYTHGYYFTSHKKNHTTKPEVFASSTELVKSPAVQKHTLELVKNEKLLNSAPSPNGQQEVKQTPLNNLTTRATHSIKVSHTKVQSQLNRFKTNLEKIQSKATPTKHRDNLSEILYSAYVGYYVILAIIAIGLLYVEYGFIVTLTIVGSILLLLLVCYAIGSFVRNLFGSK